jgi:hypothetical protein
MKSSKNRFNFIERFTEYLLFITCFRFLSLKGGAMIFQKLTKKSNSPYKFCLAQKISLQNQQLRDV